MTEELPGLTMETNPIEALKTLVSSFGPVGAIAFLMSCVIGYFYRRDHIVKQNGLKDAHERRDAREERFIIAIERLAGSISQQSKDLENHHEQEMSSLNRIEANAREAAHHAANILARQQSQALR